MTKDEFDTIMIRTMKGMDASDEELKYYGKKLNEKYDDYEFCKHMTTVAFEAMCIEGVRSWNHIRLAEKAQYN